MEFKPVTMKVSYEGGMRFTAANKDGLRIPIDAHVHLGGQGEIPNPIDYLIASLGGCVGIKILLDLTDKGITPELLTIDIQGTRKQTLPSVFEHVHLFITIKAQVDDTLLSDTLRKTMMLLCPIAAIFGSVSEVTWEHRIIDI